MSVVKIVHWKTLVGADFIRQFEDIEKSIAEKEWVGLPTETIMKDVRKAVGPDIFEEWAKKRAQLRFCGYEIENKLYYRTGWYEPGIDSGELYFRAIVRDPAGAILQFVSLESHHADQDVVRRIDEQYCEASKTKTYRLVKNTTRAVGEIRA